MIYRRQLDTMIDNTPPSNFEWRPLLSEKKIVKPMMNPASFDESS
jgi:hypothetical protein